MRRFNFRSPTVLVSILVLLVRGYSFWFEKKEVETAIIWLFAAIMVFFAMSVFFKIMKNALEERKETMNGAKDDEDEYYFS